MAGSSDDARPVHALRLAAGYGAVHAAVDGACISLLAWLDVFSSATTGNIFAGHWTVSTIWTLFVLYNCLAFGLQFSIGAVVDRSGRYHTTTLIGLALVGLAITAFRASPYVAVVLVGVGNAAFHVGAGALVLRLSPRRAAAAGIFVAPGSIGVALGAWCGKSLPHWQWFFLGALLAGAVTVCWLRTKAALDRRPSPQPISLRRGVAPLAVGALMLSVAIRSTVGLTIVRLHQGSLYILLGLALAGFLGKGIGGLISDRIGWIKTSVGALLLSAPLLAILVGNVPMAVVGVVLFQMTMPVTLLAIYHVFPEEPGLAFGLPTLALLLGAVPIFVCPLAWFSGSAPLLAMIGMSAATLLFGLPPILRRER